MTAPYLLLYIIAAMLVQLVAAAGWAIAARNRRHRDMSPAAEPVAPPVAGLAWPGWRQFRIAHREFVDAARTQCSFHLEPEDGQPLPPFEAGQYLTFSLPVPDASGAGASRPIVRCYSLSDAPGPGHYQITVKRIADGASSRHFHDRLQLGDLVSVRAPSGRFVLQPDPTLPVVMIAGGIGITPLHCMLQARLAAHPASDIRLFYGVRDGAEHAFRQTLGDLARAHPNFRLTVAYIQTRDGDVPGVE